VRAGVAGGRLLCPSLVAVRENGAVVSVLQRTCVGSLILGPSHLLRLHPSPPRSPYRAPELLFGARVHSSAVDMWSLGLTALELLRRDVSIVVAPKRGAAGADELGHECAIPADSELHALSLQSSLLGHVTPALWPDVAKLLGFWAMAPTCATCTHPDQLAAARNPSAQPSRWAAAAEATLAHPELATVVQTLRAPSCAAHAEHVDNTGVGGGSDGRLGGGQHARARWHWRAVVECTAYTGLHRLVLADAAQVQVAREVLSGMHLALSCLQYDPATRLTAAQALDHPLFAAPPVVRRGGGAAVRSGTKRSRHDMSSAADQDSNPTPHQPANRWDAVQRWVAGVLSSGGGGGRTCDRAYVYMHAHAASRCASPAFGSQHRPRSLRPPTRHLGDTAQGARTPHARARLII